jgi:hypothetical protein
MGERATFRMAAHLGYGDRGSGKGGADGRVNPGRARSQ